MNDFVSTEDTLEKAIDTVAVTRKGFRSFNRLGWAFVIFVLSETLLPLGILSLLKLFAPNILESQFFGMPFVYVCMYLIGLPLMLLLLKAVPDCTAVKTEGNTKKLGVGTLLALYPISFVVLTAFSMLSGLIEQLIGKTGTATTADLVSSGTSSWIFFVFGVIVAPIMEEIVFRRLVHKKVSGYGAGVYILWSSIIFGLFHLNFGQSIYAAALGVLLAIVMYKTGSVLYTMILHVLINFTGGVGIGSIIMRTENETALAVYSAYIMVLLVIGVVLGIIFLVRKFFVVKTEKTDNTLVNKKVAFLNPGTLVFVVFCLVFIVRAFFL